MGSISFEVGFLDRPPHRADDDGRDVRVAVRARVHDRLHARRRRLPALLQLHLAVHVLDVDARHEQQLPAALLRLGGGGRRLVSPDRLLVQAADGHLREPEGVPREPRGRLRLPARHRGARDGHGHARLRGARSRMRTASSHLSIEIIGGHPWSLLTFACICLFVGAMGKSAQMPLHVWLPDSMEGPTPISALIHAATMVTAGIFMVARMSPLFELSADGAWRRHHDRRDHGVLHGPARHRAAGHQARDRVLDAVAARLHDRGARRVGVRAPASST